MSDVRAAERTGHGGSPDLPDDWWAAGLTLAERCAPGTGWRPVPTASHPDAPTGRIREPAGAEVASGEPASAEPAGAESSGVASAPPAARERLRVWYDAHELGASGQFAARLADLDLTEDDLLALLAEAPARLAARVGEPAWARFTSRVLSQPYHRAGHPAGEDDPAVTYVPPPRPAEATGSPDDRAWVAGFGRVLAPYLDVSDDLLVRSATVTEHIDLAAVRGDFRAALSRRLVRVAVRALVRDLNNRRARGELTGATPAERFADFVRQLRRPVELRAFLLRYPVLARLLAQTCQQAVEATTELLRRLAADRPALVDTFFAGADPGRVVGIDLGAGDRHQRGRAVALLRFAGGARVVYKPRPLAVHRHFTEVLRWLNARQPELDLRTLAMLDRGGYGWVEFVPARPCADSAAVRRFYRRQGALLALLYAFDGADIHYENLVACGDQPVLVDVETLFHPYLPPSGEVHADPAAVALARSVYRSALLPQLMVGDHGALDISGLGGDRGGSSPMSMVDWQAPGTDEMRLVRRPIVFPGAANRPRLDGVDADPADFAESLLAGFRASYETIVRHREELLGPDGLVQRFADAEARVVVRATHLYLTLLDEATHPDVLRDALDRDRMLDVLWAGSATDRMRRRLVRHELAEMWHGDVPIFTLRPGERHLRTGTGEQLADVLDETPLDRVRAKLRQLSPVDRYDQEWIIGAALATRRPHRGHHTGGRVPEPFAATAPDPDRLLAAARAVADQIIARGFDNGDRINWLGLELLDERYWTVMPLGASLGSGYAGTALFLAQLAAVTADARYAEVARRALRPVPGLVARLESAELAGAVGGGGFAGFGGIAYALAQVAVLLGDPDIADWVEPVVRLAGVTIDDAARIDGAGAPADTGGYGVHDGLAGCLAAMLAVHAMTGLAAAWQVARRCADRFLSEPIGPTAAPGFAFGLAGAGWALLRFAAAAGDPRAAARGREYLRDPARLGRVTGHSWCHGWPGVGLALLDVADPAPDPGTDAVIERSVAAVVTSGPLPNHSLCHGELGRLELLGAAARAGRATPASHIRHAGMLLAAIERCGPRCGTPDGVPNPGLLTGLAGIGHGLLRLGFPDTVPSVLLLQPPDHQPRTP